MRELVTGEAVVVDLAEARLASRAAALALDALVQAGALLAALFGISALLGRADEQLLGALGLVAIVGALLGYPVTMETLTRGRTLGKMALGLRAVRDDGGPLRLRHALVRGLVGILELWATAGGVALIASLVSRRGKRLGDVFAGTLVVRERTPDTGAGPMPMPPGCAGWAAGLQLTGLPDHLALSARQLLARRGQLSPPAWEATTRELATAVADRVAPAPPPGMPADIYLAAVLAERRRRAESRAEGRPMSRPPPPGSAPAQPPPPRNPRRPPPYQPPGDVGGFAPPG
jgi:uncharacterized RDD family membrane protein YckC